MKASKNNLSTSMMTIFMDSVKKSYFSLAEGFAAELAFIKVEKSTNGKVVMAYYRRGSDQKILILSSFDLANAIVVTNKQVKTLKSTGTPDIYLDSSVSDHESLVTMVAEEKALPLTIKIVGATVTESVAYSGYNAKISKILVGYNLVKAFLNNANGNTQYPSYEEYVDGISQMKDSLSTR